jgi:hypothetical protein
VTIGDAAKDAMPLLIRSRVLDAVRAAQAEAGGPVTAAEVLVKLSPPIARSPRALTALLHRVAATGADETGRRLAGDIDRLSVWRWVVEGGDPRDAEIAARAAALAQPGEDLQSVLLRALDALGLNAHAPPLAQKVLSQWTPTEGRFWSDGSDITVTAWDAPEAAPPVTQPDPTPNASEPPAEPPQETPTAVQPPSDLASASPPVDAPPDPLSAMFALPKPSSESPAGPLRAALERARAWRSES